MPGFTLHRAAANVALRFPPCHAAVSYIFKVRPAVRFHCRYYSRFRGVPSRGANRSGLFSICHPVQEYGGSPRTSAPRPPEAPGTDWMIEQRHRAERNAFGRVHQHPRQPVRPGGQRRRGGTGSRRKSRGKSARVEPRYMGQRWSRAIRGASSRCCCELRRC